MSFFGYAVISDHDQRVSRLQKNVLEAQNELLKIKVEDLEAELAINREMLKELCDNQDYYEDDAEVSFEGCDSELPDGIDVEVVHGENTSLAFVECPKCHFYSSYTLNHPITQRLLTGDGVYSCPLCNATSHVVSAYHSY